MQNQTNTSSRCCGVSDPHRSETSHQTETANERQAPVHPLIADALADTERDAVSWTKG